MVAEPEEGRDVTLIATGSEVSIAHRSCKAARNGQTSAPPSSRRRASNCSPSKSREYRRPSSGSAPRIGIEAAVEGDWARWLGASGEFVGMTGFGASAPAAALYREFGITAEAVAAAAARCLARTRMKATHS